MKILKLICLLSLIVTISCGENNKAATNVADSKEEDVLSTESEQSEAALNTTDRSICDVKGHVKEITDITGKLIIAKFDKNGNLLNYGISDRISNVKRDDENRLLEFLGCEWVKIEWNGNVPVSKQLEYDSYTYSETYTRDDNGNIIILTVRLHDLFEDEDMTETRIVKYDSDSFDSRGNWLKRTIIFPNDGGYDVQERKITYYE